MASKTISVLVVSKALAACANSFLNFYTKLHCAVLLMFHRSRHWQMQKTRCMSIYVSCLYALMQYRIC